MDLTNNEKEILRQGLLRLPRNYEADGLTKDETYSLIAHLYSQLTLEKEVNEL